MQRVPGPGNWTNHFNFRLITGCPTTTAHVKVFDYPRLQLLANGQLMWADSHDEPTANHASRYLDIQSLAWCPGETEHQWKDATTPSALRLDTGTAHFLVWN